MQVTGFDFGEIKNVVEQGEQRLASLEDRSAVILPFEHAHVVVQKHLCHAEDAVQRRADLVAHGREEAAFCHVGRFGGLFCLDQLVLGLFARRDILAGPAITLEFTRAVEDRRAADAEPLTTHLGTYLVLEIPERHVFRLGLLMRGPFLLVRQIAMAGKVFPTKSQKLVGVDPEYFLQRFREIGESQLAIRLPEPVGR